MTKINAFEWAAKLMDAIAEMPDDVQVASFELRLNTDAKPFGNILSIQLREPVKHNSVVNGKRYSGWQEKRIYMQPDVYVWWSEDIKDGTDT